MSSAKTIGKERISEAMKRASPPETEADERLTEAIELLFFGYRDFISDPDAILTEYEFGRAHHRVVHFVGRNPGITVAELLDILRITKQSLARVLRQLIERGFIEQKTGEKDRRQRRLYLTEAGAELLRRLVAPQRDRVRKALAAAGPGAETAWRSVMFSLLNEENRPEVEHIIAKDSK
ncbi:MAG TPA: MarR family transcriptional regulator [Parvibaculum sp.]|jgi:DNA-binding MarR family transcriptional regulator